MTFVEKDVNYFMFMQLTDLAYAFTKQDVEIEYNQVSFLDVYNKLITISSFWEQRTSEQHLGEKSDIYLRAIGNLHYTNKGALERFFQKHQQSPNWLFRKQLLALLEDLRLEDLIKRKRPGTEQSFQFRRQSYAQFFLDQLKVNQSRGFKADTLFSYIALSLFQSKLTEVNLPFHEGTLRSIKEKVFTVFECNHTDDVMTIVEQIGILTNEILPNDMINAYFTLPMIQPIQTEKTEEDEAIDELLPTWSMERKKETKETFLQFDLSEGDQPSNNYNTGRESEATDQVMGLVEGSAQQSDLHDHSQSALDTLDTEENFHKGSENRYAVAIEEPIEDVTAVEKEQYFALKQKISAEKRKLTKYLQKLLERKREDETRRLHFGKLDRNVTRFFTNDNPKMFIKKEESNQFDCSFLLLVDCSSSMNDKMEQTKEAVTLFHETLKGMGISHSVIGFSEDGIESDDTYQPNIFQHFIPFPLSTTKQVGPNIMKLAPMEDNRDGFAIRYGMKEMLRQKEQKKFIIVITDGKPAAYNYYQNGVFDTKEAVMEAKKAGIDTIGIQIGDDGEHLQEMMEAIYNNQYMTIDEMNMASAQFAALLRKLLVHSVPQ
ncbi:vWA domain-containing protein [Salirhabdus salicampi]|uniref:vWA domain-containing protein n=1 Tax=Salirhabdus salicampi TaxID=476102 RepID=UPI0020C50BC1|nr:VWA domain-containing protein [Salirhabdus salicampi]MCP8616149.1 VWA domain-containing protein [Salirhabdus salicampi]